MRKQYTVGEVAKYLGISRDTVRYYDKKNIVIARKDDKGYRYYTREDIIALSYVLNLKVLRISLKDIQFMMSESSLDKSIQIVKKHEEKIKKELRDMSNCLSVINDYRISLEGAQKYCNSFSIEKNSVIIYKKIVDYNEFDVIGEFNALAPNHTNVLSFLIDKDLFLSDEIGNFNNVKHNFVPIVSMIDDDKEGKEDKYIKNGFLLYEYSKCAKAIIDTYANYDYTHVIEIRKKIVEQGYKIIGDVMWRSICLRNAPRKIHDYHELWIPVE